MYLALFPINYNQVLYGIFCVWKANLMYLPSAMFQRRTMLESVTQQQSTRYGSVLAPRAEKTYRNRGISGKKSWESPEH